MFMVKSQHQLVFDVDQRPDRAKPGHGISQNSTLLKSICILVHLHDISGFLPIINTVFFFYSISFPLLRIRRSSEFHHRSFFPWSCGECLLCSIDVFKVV